jgi:hypothetical protein
MSLHIRNSKNRMYALIVAAMLGTVFVFSLQHVSPYSSAASTPLAIDGHRAIKGNGTATLGFSTTQSPDVIIALVSISSNTSVSPTISDTYGLTWTNRTVNGAGHYYATFGAALYEYYAIANTPLSGDEVTVTIPLQKSITVRVFGISGANTASPFDPGITASTASSGGLGNPQSRPFTTTYANDMILGLAFVSGGATVTNETGFTNVGGEIPTTPQAYAEYEVVTSPWSDQPVSAILSTTNQWIMIGDAVQAASSFTSTSSTTTTTPTTSSSSTTTTTSSQTTTTTTNTTLTHSPPSTTTKSSGGLFGSINVTLAAIIAVVIVVAAIGISIFMRRRV